MRPTHFGFRASATLFVLGVVAITGGSIATAALYIDAGAGMDAGKVSKLFRSFSQVEDAANRVQGGTSLGLVISRELAKMLGGGITVSSEPGNGLIFTVYIMAPPCAAPAGIVDRRHVSDDAAHPGGGAVRPTNAADGVRVLLAEDGIDDQRLISLYLRRAGIRVESVENGALVLDAIDVRPAGYDVLIIDMQMPVMDGYTAARTLRPKGYLGPILALTAHAMTGDRERCLTAGCDDYATKPIQPAELIAKVLAMAAASREIASGRRTPRHYDTVRPQSGGVLRPAHEGLDAKANARSQQSPNKVFSQRSWRRVRREEKGEEESRRNAMRDAIFPGFSCQMPFFALLRSLHCKICFEASHQIATRPPTDGIELILRLSWT